MNPPHSPELLAVAKRMVWFPDPPSGLCEPVRSSQCDQPAGLTRSQHRSETGRIVQEAPIARNQTALGPACEKSPKVVVAGIGSGGRGGGLAPHRVRSEDCQQPGDLVVG